MEPGLEHRGGYRDVCCLKQPASFGNSKVVDVLRDILECEPIDRAGYLPGRHTCASRQPRQCQVFVSKQSPIKLVALTRYGTYSSIDGAVHFSFLPECKEGGAQLLKSSGEVDPVCEDRGGRSRADIHAELNDLVLDALQRTLKNSQ